VLPPQPINQLLCNRLNSARLCFAVYKAICKRSRETVVLKCYLMSSICELYQHQIYREVRLHSSCQHENIIKLFAAFQVRHPACVWNNSCSTWAFCSAFDNA
jgi:serine/threonine protein kinase